MVLLSSVNSQPETIVSRSNQIASVRSQVSPWLTPLAYSLGCWVVLPSFFRIRITGQENVPGNGPVILAPTHRSRWDALLVPYAVGRFVTGRDIRFMVTSDEMNGFQGWLIRHLGGFPVNPRNPAIASLRYGVEVLQNQEMLVIFPEGGIFRDQELHHLKPGLARLALQAESSQSDLGVKIVPIHLDYSDPVPKWGCQVNIHIGEPLAVADYKQGNAKRDAQRLTVDLEKALQGLTDRHPDFVLNDAQSLSADESPALN
ncbi:MAG: 1-acyl-sn-glycerol-3-phosphate acyltransferase [Cyanobacteria bacterium CRU_2_1]|nr:1-acyl-sn-glycerol-3-phosphate acyltransferase [Cyanobacteria bacterium RU_5_0]NJR62277.1 1-acyl-sn-glycerol-3-phosphate acyltransferase [Cyanobacteria bacterium CRU_2_1]